MYMVHVQNRYVKLGSIIYNVLSLYIYRLHFVIASYPGVRTRLIL